MDPTSSERAYAPRRHTTAAASNRGDPGADRVCAPYGARDAATPASASARSASRVRPRRS